MTAMLAGVDLSVRYGSASALDGVDIEVGEAQFVAVVGSNGAGKSTLVNALSGWSRGRPSVAGKVLLDDVEVSRWPAHRRSRHGIVLVPEGKGLFQDLSVEDNIRLVRAPQPDVGGAPPASLDDIWDLFPQLRDRASAKCGTLSGGERQMVAVARSLRAGPRVLVLDEPSVGLAPRLISQMLERIRSLVTDKMSVLLVEQNVQAVLDVADVVYLLERGAVAAKGTAAQMRNDDRVIQAYLGEAMS